MVSKEVLKAYNSIIEELFYIKPKISDFQLQIQSIRYYSERKELNRYRLCLPVAEDTKICIESRDSQAHARASRYLRLYRYYLRRRNYNKAIKNMRLAIKHMYINTRRIILLKRVAERTFQEIPLEVR